MRAPVRGVRAAHRSPPVRLRVMSLSADLFETRGKTQVGECALRIEAEDIEVNVAVDQRYRGVLVEYVVNAKCQPRIVAVELVAQLQVVIEHRRIGRSS